MTEKVPVREVRLRQKQRFDPPEKRGENRAYDREKTARFRAAKAMMKQGILSGEKKKGPGRKISIKSLAGKGKRSGGTSKKE